MATSLETRQISYFPRLQSPLKIARFSHVVNRQIIVYEYTMVHVMHSLILLGIQCDLHHWLWHLPYLCCPDFLQPNRQIVVEQWRKLYHIRLTPIIPSRPLLSDICKLFRCLTLRFKHPLQKYFSSRSLMLKVSTGSSLLKSSIEYKKMLRLINVDENGEVIAEGKSKNRKTKGREG